MAVPAPHHPVWSRLATGGLSKVKTSQLAAQLFIKRIETSKSPTPQKAKEIFDFFAKYERIMGNELQQLSAM